MKEGTLEFQEKELENWMSAYCTIYDDAEIHQVQNRLRVDTPCWSMYFLSDYIIQVKINFVGSFDDLDSISFALDELKEAMMAQAKGERIEWTKSNLLLGRWW